MASKLCSSFACVFVLFNFVLPIYSHSEYSQLHPISTNASSPFEFLRNLQGCQKGENVKGNRQLKLYLTQFGYLNRTNFVEEDDDFDEEVEAAIKSYQAFYHLNVSGELDEPTVSRMLMPRCGFPDKQTHLHTISRYQFFPGRPKWEPKGRRHLTYAFGSGFPTRFKPAVARALRSRAIGSRYFVFSRVDSFESADLKISFERGDHGDGSPFDGRGGVLAHSAPPMYGVLHFDADDLWADGAVPNAFDVETVALHEIGHLLGLGHSQDEHAIMWAYIGAGVTKGLNPDDVRGIRALYTT